MNIFFLHHDPKLCAQMHNDKHIVKMILETAQLLSTTHHVLDPSAVPSPIYKKTHVNHPCAIWVRQCELHYMWTHALLKELCTEYTVRYGKVHKTEHSGVVQALSEFPNIVAMRRNWVDPPQCMPDEFKSESCVQAYRNYYMGPKAHLGVWTNREAPVWWDKQ